MSYNFLFYYNNHTIHLHIGPILMHAFINIHEYSQKLTFFLLANLMGGILDFKIHIVILFPPCSISKKTVLKFIKCPNLCFESQTRNIYNYPLPLLDKLKCTRMHKILQKNTFTTMEAIFLKKNPCGGTLQYFWGVELR